jgi:hypothetical protein
VSSWLRGKHLTTVGAPSNFATIGFVLHSFLRASVVTLLVAAFLALPCAFDQCVASCEQRQAATTRSADPVCQRPGSPALRQAPDSCGRDHSKNPNIAESGADVSRRPFADVRNVPAAAQIPVLDHAARAELHLAIGFRSFPTRLPHSISSPIRV